jgi:hypothetical protein
MTINLKIQLNEKIKKLEKENEENLFYQILKELNQNL